MGGKCEGARKREEGKSEGKEQKEDRIVRKGKQKEKEKRDWEKGLSGVMWKIGKEGRI